MNISKDDFMFIFSLLLMMTGFWHEEECLVRLPDREAWQLRGQLYHKGPLYPVINLKSASFVSLAHV